MNPSARALADLCRAAGRRVPQWTQGTGGNISVKDEDGALWIKASGLRLDQVGARGGLEGTACVRLAAFTAGLDDVGRA